MKKKKSENVKLKRKSTVYVNHQKKKIKRKVYSSESLEHAITALNNGSTLRQAANAYGIPVATLYRKKNCTGDVKSKSGPPTILSNSEEDKIKNWIIDRAEKGYPVSKTELLDCVQKYIISLDRPTPFVDNRPGRHWYEAFRRRHQELSIRTAQHLSLTRSAVTQEDLQEWFQRTRQYLQKKKLINISADRIFNCDETSILLCPDSEKILTRRGSKSAYKITDDRKESVTTLFTYSAVGTRAPPMPMFAYVGSLPKVISESVPQGWGAGVSENGWMTSESFYEYISNVLYPWLVKENLEFPVILYLDNHSSHDNIPLATFCRQKKIEIIPLHPNSTHIMQPLDIAFFHPFKEAWRKTVPKWKSKTNILQLKKEHFSKVLKMTLDSMENEKTIVINGFKAAGLMPFNSNAVDYNILQKRKQNQRNSTEMSSNNKEIQVSVNDIEDEQRHIQTFENNLPFETLQAFQEALENGSWTVDIKQQALFEYWLKISKKSLGGSLRAQPEMQNSSSGSNNSIHEVPINNMEISFARSDSPEVRENVEPLPILDITVLESNSLDTKFQDLPIDIIELDVLSDGTVSLDSSKILNTSEIESTAQVFQQPSSVSIEEVLGSNQEAESNEGENNTPDTLSSEHTLNSLSNSSLANKENIAKIVNQESSNLSEDPFPKVFTMPTKYLPKKKRAKIQASGKPKPPAAITSDEWLQQQLEKEEKQRLKEEMILKRKELQKQKKLLAEEKKKIEAKMKEEKKKVDDKMKKIIEKIKKERV